MLFDARAALAEILKSQPPVATPANAATNKPHFAQMSQMSQLSQAVVPEIGHATSPSAGNNAPRDTYRHGRDMNGNPKTWTGRPVTLDVWQGLTEWERHGSTGQVWNGITRTWEPATMTR